MNCDTVTSDTDAMLIVAVTAIMYRLTIDDLFVVYYSFQVVTFQTFLLSWRGGSLKSQMIC